MFPIPPQIVTYVKQSNLKSRSELPKGGRHDSNRCCSTRQSAGNGKHSYSSVSSEYSGSGVDRITQAHKRDKMARKRNRLGLIPGRATRDHAETRALLGDRLQLAQLRSETAGSTTLRHGDRWARHSFHSRPLET